MISIGVTGGIGSGKSTVCKIFEVLGVPVYYADLEAKRLINTNWEVKNSILTLLGEQSYINDTYNVPFVKDVVLKDKDLLLKLNNIVHPAVAIHYKEWLKKYQDKPYIVKEAAIMNKEAGQDKIIYVFASNDIRVKRTLDRDLERNKSEVEMIIAKQKTEQEFREISDFVVYNNDELIIPQVLKIHKEILENFIS